MDFVNQTSSNPGEKQFTCYLIANLIPEINDISFLEIQNVLDVVQEGL